MDRNRAGSSSNHRSGRPSQPVPRQTRHEVMTQSVANVVFDVRIYFEGEKNGTIEMGKTGVVELSLIHI